MEDFSVCIIAYNEAEYLPRLLNSLKGVEDIVVLDTGSTDNTIEVAKSFGCNVISVGTKFKYMATESQVRKWKNRFGWNPNFVSGKSYFHFADARNEAAKYAKNDFIFCPDCDEEVHWDLNKVKEAIQNEDHLTYNFVFAHNPDGTPAVQFTQCKFFRKSKFKWTKWVHEVETPILGTNPKPPFYVDFIKHEHWQNPTSSRSNYLPGLELSVLDNFDDDRNVYYLGREYMWARKWDEAILMLKHAIKLSGWPDERSEAKIFTGNCYKAKKEFEKSIEYYHMAMEDAPNRREPFFAMGDLYDEMGQLDKAVIYYQAAMAIPFKEHGYLNSMELYGESIPDRLAFAYARMNDVANSKKWWLEALKYNPSDRVLNNFKFYYGEDPLVSIIVPTVREDGYNKLLKSIISDSSYSNYEVIKMNDEGTAIEKFNRGVEQSNGNFIVYLADDTEVQHGWLIQAYSKWKENFENKGLVILNDGYWNGQMANHFFCSKNIKSVLDGEIWYSGYHHIGVDNELYQRLKKLNLVVFAENSKIIHHHPFTPTNGTQPAPYDEFYNRQQQYLEDDRNLLYKRQKLLNFGPKIAVFCTTYNNESIIEEFVKENLKYVDEVYISDNQSTDNTVSIAKMAGANVRLSGLVHTPENYNESITKQKALNFAMESGECDWMLYLDSDEILDEKAKDLLPIYINDLSANSYGMRLPTFWLDRIHYRTDSDFGNYLVHPYPLKLFRRNCSIKMTNPPKGGHSFPAVNGNVNFPFPQFGHKDVELCVKHYAFPNREIAFEKYKRYLNSDPFFMMSKSTKHFEHLDPDYKGIKLAVWGQELDIEQPYYENGIDGFMGNTELRWLNETAKKMNSILEIGSWKGRSTHALLSGCKGTVTAVDTFMGTQDPRDLTFGLAKQQDIYSQFMNNVGYFKNLEVVRMTSEEASKELGNRRFDMIFIDANHAYEEIKKDILLWKDKANIIICGHDYDKTDFGVMQAVDELFGKPDEHAGEIWINYRPERIPKKIHTIWLSEDKEIPELVEKCIKSQQIEGYEFHLITLDNCWKDNRYIQDALSSKKWVKAVDFLRMHYLYEEGGIFLDADVELLKNFDNLLHYGMFAARENNGFIGTAIMGAEKNHPFIKHWMDEVLANFKGNDNLYFQSSVEVLTKGYFEKEWENEDFILLPTETFYPYDHQNNTINITDSTITYHNFLKSWVKDL